MAKINIIKTLNFKQKLLFRMTFVILALIFLLVNLGMQKEKFGRDVLKLDTNINGGIVKEMSISKEGIKFSVDEINDKYTECFVYDENEQYLENDKCYMPVNSKIGYLIFDDKSEIKGSYYIGYGDIDIDSFSNYQNLSDENEYELDKDFQFIKVVPKYILQNKSQTLSDVIPTKEELAILDKQALKDYLIRNKEKYNQELMNLNVTLSSLKSQIQNQKNDYKNETFASEKENILINIDDLEKQVKILEKEKEKYKILIDYKIFKNI